MELNNPFSRSKAPKAPDQPKIDGAALIERLMKAPSQQLDPFELGDGDIEPSSQELQHRIFMIEQTLNSLVNLIETDHKLLIEIARKYT